MFNISKFISDNITFRYKSMFLADIENNSEIIRKEVEGKSLCVIGGAGSIGSSFIKAILVRFVCWLVSSEIQVKYSFLS